jgi:hypothetical protein
VQGDLAGLSRTRSPATAAILGWDAEDMGAVEAARAIEPLRQPSR